MKLSGWNRLFVLIAISFAISSTIMVSFKYKELKLHLNIMSQYSEYAATKSKERDILEKKYSIMKDEEKKSSSPLQYSIDHAGDYMNHGVQTALLSDLISENLEKTQNEQTIIAKIKKDLANVLLNHLYLLIFTITFLFCLKWVINGFNAK